MRQNNNNEKFNQNKRFGRIDIRTCEICELQLSLWWQTCKPLIGFIPWTSLPQLAPFAHLPSIGFRYFLSGLNSQSIDSLFKYMESTIMPLRTINKNVRRDLCVRNNCMGHNEPSRISMSKTCSDDSFFQRKKSVLKFVILDPC